MGMTQRAPRTPFAGNSRSVHGNYGSEVSDALLSLVKSVQSNGFAKSDTSEVKLARINERVTAFAGAVIGTGACLA